MAVPALKPRFRDSRENISVNSQIWEDMAPTSPPSTLGSVEFSTTADTMNASSNTSSTVAVDVPVKISSPLGTESTADLEKKNSSEHNKNCLVDQEEIGAANDVPPQTRATSHTSLPHGYNFCRCLSEDVKCMSHVVLAVDGKTQRQVVLKRAKTDDKHKYIERELHILKQCEGHPHIVQLVENELVDGWLVVEYMGGGSFETECEVPQNLTHLEVLQIAEATSKALAFLHSKNIIHRDVKPHNIFFERDEYNEITTIKLADVGIAMEVTCNLTATRFSGTKQYSSPEAVQNRVGPASDMWSWACTIAHLATGVKPYEGDDKSIPYSDELQDTELPPAFFELLMECFNQRTLKRPTAAEASHGCQRWLDSIMPVVGEPDDDDRNDTRFLLSDAEYELLSDGTSTSVPQLTSETVAHELPTDSHFSQLEAVDVIAERQLSNTHHLLHQRTQSATSSSSEEDRRTATPTMAVELHRVKSQLSCDGDHTNDCDGMTLLHRSAQDGDVEAIELLVHQEGVDISVRDNDQWTPLHVAVAFGHMNVIHVLLEAGADVSDGEGQCTLMHLAAQIGHAEAISVLAEAGASVSGCFLGQQTPLHIATRYDHPDAIEALLAVGADPSCQDERLWAPLHFAARGHSTAVRHLLDAGADVSCQTDTLWTPLHFAARKGHVESIEMLLRAGADVSSLNEDYYTPLHLAARNGHAAAITILVDAGADASCRTDALWTPLHIATQKDHREAIDALVNAKADISALDEDHWTPLHHAADFGRTAAIKILVEAGADISSRDKDHWTPLHLAAQNAHMPAIQALIKAGADVSCQTDALWTPLHFAARSGHVEVIKELLRAGANVTCQKEDRWTPLHLAARNSHVDAIDVLLKAGADVTILTDAHRTPLCIAAQTRRVDVCEALIRGGAIPIDIVCCQTLPLSLSEPFPHHNHHHNPPPESHQDVDFVKSVLSVSVEMPMIELMDERSKQFGGGASLSGEGTHKALLSPSSSARGGGGRHRSCVIS